PLRSDSAGFSLKDMRWPLLRLVTAHPGPAPRVAASRSSWTCSAPPPCERLELPSLLQVVEYEEVFIWSSCCRVTSSSASNSAGEGGLVEEDVQDGEAWRPRGNHRPPAVALHRRGSPSWAKTELNPNTGGCQ